MAATLAVLTLFSASMLTPVTANVGADDSGSPSSLLTSYPLPPEWPGAPGHLLQADGRLWFTAPAPDVNAIGSLVIADTGAYTYTFYPIPTNDSTPYDLTWDGENIWFTEYLGNKLGRLHVASEIISEYVIPTQDSGPTGISWDADGLVWFVQRAGNNLAAFDPLTESFTEYAITDSQGNPFPEALPEDVAVYMPKNWVWFTVPGVNRLMQFDKDTKDFKAIPTANPGAFYTPSQVAVDDLGNPWVSTWEGRIGRFQPETFQYFRWYLVAPEDSKIEGLQWIADGRRNKLWFTESNTGYTGQLLTDSGGGTINTWRFPVTSAAGHLSGLVVSDQAMVWLADNANHQLIRWAPPYISSSHLPLVLVAD